MCDLGLGWIHHLWAFINQHVHADRACPDPFLRRITALMGTTVAGVGVNPADQRWGFWPLLPLSFLLRE